MTSTTSRSAVPSAAVEDYAKAIYALQEREDGAVATNALADRLQVTPGSVSAMLRRLSERGLVEHVPYRGVQLTTAGRHVALEVLRHHRLLELFLVRELGMSWDRVHDEAELLEHVISEEVEAAIAAKLGEPAIDPHGDPIPTVDLQVPEARIGEALDGLDVGARGTFLRVSDADPAMLRYLSEHGIAPGDPLQVVDRQPFGGPLFVAFGDPLGPPLAIGGRLAASIRVEVRT